VRQVYVAGELAAENRVLAGHLRFDPTPVPPVAVRVPLDKLDFAVPAQTETMRLIEVVPGQIVTRAETVIPLVRDGLAVSDVTRDILKMAVVERHQDSGRAGLGFIRGFGLSRGALASSVAHDSHNIIAVGVADDDLHLAVRALKEMGGGLAAVADGQVLARVPLPIAGLMSDLPVEKVRAQLDAVIAAARSLGTSLPDPFMTLSFMALPVIPQLKLTDKGLVDVDKFEIVPLFVS
jgi:adenine deaminase